jgi:ssDNA-binding replication factor A large subunit
MEFDGGGWHLSSEDLKKHAQDVLSILGNDTKTSVNIDDILGQLERFLEYGVPINQAKQTIVKKYGGSNTFLSSALERTKLSDLETDTRSVKILAQVITINPKEITVKGEPRQIFYGILRDESGSVPFTSWHDIQVQNGEVVEIANAYTTEWQGTVQINIGNRTQVDKKDSNALPKEAYEPKKVTIYELHPLMGAIDLSACILEIEEKEVEVDGEKKIVFSGILGDTTGKVPFSAWYDFKLKKNETIAIKGGYIRNWKGIPQITFDEKATVSKVKKDPISAKDVPLRIVKMYEVEEHPGLYDIQVEGTIIEIQRGSGFILRCPQCNRMIRDKQCKDHGTVDGITDFRLKCIVDDGTGTMSATFNKKISEDILEKTEEDLKEMDPKTLGDTIKERVFGKRIQLNGNTVHDQFGTTCIVKAVAFIDQDIQKDAADLMKSLEGEL